MRRLFTFILVATLLGAAYSQSTKPKDKLDPVIAERFSKAKEALVTKDYETVMFETTLILSNGPLTVTLDTSKLDEELIKPYSQKVTEAVELWNNTFSGEPVFIFVDKPEDAQIKIRFVDGMVDGNQYLCGHVSWKRNLKWDGKSEKQNVKISADIRISIYEGELDDAHQPDSIFHIAAHELGHVLGLDDSASSKDIMGPDLHGNPATQLQSGELQAIRHLRADCLRMRGKALSHMKLWKDAEIEYMRALAIMPDNAVYKEELSEARKHCSQ